jgi:CDP-diacylglycerol pyrophosphatase
MFNQYLDLSKKAETGQEKTRKTRKKQVKTCSRESIKNDHESFILIKQTTQTHVNIHIYCIASQISNQIAQTPTASIKQHTQKWSKW